MKRKLIIIIMILSTFFIFLYFNLQSKYSWECIYEDHGAIYNGKKGKKQAELDAIKHQSEFNHSTWVIQK